MTITALTSLAARDEIEIAAIQQPGDLTTALATANDQRGSSSGRVWFLVTELDVEAPCRVVGVRGSGEHWSGSRMDDSCQPTV
jgi:hypothetical protein